MLVFFSAAAWTRIISSDFLHNRSSQPVATRTLRTTWQGGVKTYGGRIQSPLEILSPDQPGSNVGALCLANLSIPRKRFAFVFEAQEVLERAASERVAEHLRRVLQNEHRVAAKCRRDVTDFHPTLDFPSHVLGFFR